VVIENRHAQQFLFSILDSGLVRFDGTGMSLRSSARDAATSGSNRAFEYAAIGSGIATGVEDARGGRLAALLDDRQEGFEVVQTFHFDIPPFGMLHHRIR
jgi:hypothetical protein